MSLRPRVVSVNLGRELTRSQCVGLRLGTSGLVKYMPMTFREHVLHLVEIVVVALLVRIFQSCLCAECQYQRSRVVDLMHVVATGELLTHVHSFHPRPPALQ